MNTTAVSVLERAAPCADGRELDKLRDPRRMNSAAASIEARSRSAERARARTPARVPSGD